MTGFGEVTDLCVVGGGPAGAATAIAATRAGLHVTVVDKAVFPRDKTCGDGLTASALRLLEDLGLQPARVPSWTVVDEVVVVSPSGRRVELPLPAGTGQYAAVATRVDLDAALLDVARAAGAAVIEGASVRSVDTADATLVTLELSDERRLQARYVVAADGMYSTVRRLVAPAASATGTERLALNCSTCARSGTPSRAAIAPRRSRCALAKATDST